MKVLQLARSRMLLWARERGGNEAAFEVSRAVEGPLLERCATAPRCPEPGTRGEAATPAAASASAGRAGTASPAPPPLDPAAPAASDCPYAFERVGDCVLHRNRRALEAGLFRPMEAQLARRLLEAIGYEVESEGVDPLHEDAGRILRAHRPLSRRSEVRVLSAPYGGRSVLVRDGEREGGVSPPRGAGGRP